MIPKKSKDGQWFFTIRATNGKKIATSETYKTRAGCIKGIKAAIKAALLVKDIYFYDTKLESQTSLTTEK